MSVGYAAPGSPAHPREQANRRSAMASSLLTNEQIRRIHEASLTILERVGVEAPHSEMLRRFADAGAAVDAAASGRSIF